MRGEGSVKSVRHPLAAADVSPLVSSGQVLESKPGEEVK